MEAAVAPAAAGGACGKARLVVGFGLVADHSGEEQLELRDYLIAQGYNYDGTKEGNKIAKAISAPDGWLYKTSDEFGKPVPDLIGMAGNQPESNNRTGYSARPAGSRWAGWGDGAFHSRQTSVYWWSVTPHSKDDAYHTSIHTWFAKYGDNHHTKTFGFSIRLIRDKRAN